MTYRSEKWRRNVAALDYCVLCGCWGVQVAHRNEGKGMGMKVSDALTAALCPDCHTRIDQGKDYDKGERRATMDRAIVLTLERLADRGLVRPA